MLDSHAQHAQHAQREQREQREQQSSMARLYKGEAMRFFAFTE